VLGVGEKTGCRVLGVGGRGKEMGQGMESYKDLIVYQKAYKLSLEIYKATKKFPPEELYGLIS
jgi:hypothetical protein